MLIVCFVVCVRFREHQGAPLPVEMKRTEIRLFPGRRGSRFDSCHKSCRWQLNVLTVHRTVIHYARAASLRRPLQNRLKWIRIFLQTILGCFLGLSGRPVPTMKHVNLVGTGVLDGPNKCKTTLLTGRVLAVPDRLRQQKRGSTSRRPSVRVL